MDQGKVVVITGASAGIGAALARQLGREGHRVVLGARRASELRRVAEDIGENARSVATDVTRRAEVERLRDRAIDAFGHVDVWVNNAGRGISVPVLELTDEQFDEMMSVNVKSVLYGMQAIVPHFQERGRGHIVNVSSFLGRVPLVAFRSAYNAAKAALNALTANLRMDLRREWPDIYVSLVMPGIVATEFARNALGGTPAVPAAPGGRRLDVQSADDVASRIGGLIAEPKAELYTQPGQPAMAARYYTDVDAFERSLGQ